MSLGTRPLQWPTLCGVCLSLNKSTSYLSLCLQPHNPGPLLPSKIAPTLSMECISSLDKPSFTLKKKDSESGNRLPRGGLGLSLVGVFWDRGIWGLGWVRITWNPHRNPSMFQQQCCLSSLLPGPTPTKCQPQGGRGWGLEGLPSPCSAWLYSSCQSHQALKSSSKAARADPTISCPSWLKLSWPAALGGGKGWQLQRGVLTAPWEDLGMGGRNLGNSFQWSVRQFSKSLVGLI